MRSLGQACQEEEVQRMVWEYDEDGSGEVLFPLAQQRGEAGTETKRVGAREGGGKGGWERVGRC